MISLTPRQADLLSFIKRYAAAHGEAPSFSEMKHGVGVASKSAVFALLAALEEREAIRRMKNAPRGIEIVGPIRHRLPDPIVRMHLVGLDGVYRSRPAGRWGTAYLGPYPIRTHQTCADMFRKQREA